MKQIITKCFPKSLNDFCCNQLISKHEQEFSKDFISHSEGKENLFKLENINNSFTYEYNYTPRYHLYRHMMVNEVNEQMIPASEHRFNDSGIESENSSNWQLSSQSMIENDLIRINSKMVLEELESTVLLNKERLIINAAGLVNSARNANDGFAFFGNSFQNSSGKIINDYEITISNSKQLEANGNGNGNGNSNSNDDHLFVIYFKKSSQHYYLRSYTNSMTKLSYILLKLGDISSPYAIKQNELLMIGDMVFKLRIEANGELIIVKLSNQKSPEEIIVKYNVDQSKITIGRDSTCSLPFTSEINISKIQCTFEYIEASKSWMIYDGGRKASTNGTWIMPRHSVDITQGCTFKLFGSSKFALYPLAC